MVTAYIKKYQNVSNNFGRLLLYLFLAISAPLLAQENPPIPIQVEVNTAQYLNFGAFITGNTGGTVIVDPTGLRTPSGDIILLDVGQPASPALFDLTANPGTIINIMPPGAITLNGSNGGAITLDINSFSTGKTFITSASSFNITDVFVGGTLTVGNSSASPAGIYNGTFTLTFIQE